MLKIKLKATIWQAYVDLFVALKSSTASHFVVIQTILFILGSLACVYFPFFHYTDQHEVGLVLNVLDGSVSIDKPGFNVTAPWKLVSKADTRSQKVCVTSVSRTMNCKLVQFNPTFYAEFVKTEGFRYYWWDNRISYNSGYTEEYRGFRDVLRGYAFSATQHPWIVELAQSN